MTMSPRQALCADLVWAAIEQAKPDGLSTAQLVLVTELKLSQVRNGILGEKLGVAAERGTPLTWVPGVGFCHSDDPSVWFTDELRKMRIATTMLERMVKGTLDPHLARVPSAKATTLSNEVGRMIKIGQETQKLWP
jgi:hypothetical protein